LILWHASARRMRVSAVNGACAAAHGDHRSVRSPLSARWRSNLCLLFWPHATRKFFYRRAEFSSFATTWRRSLTDTMTSSAIACCHRRQRFYRGLRRGGAAQDAADVQEGVPIGLEALDRIQCLRPPVLLVLPALAVFQLDATVQLPFGGDHDFLRSSRALTAA